MYRRRLLSGLAGASTLGVAGCSGLGGEGGPPGSDTASRTTEPTRAPAAEPISLPVPETALEKAAPRDAIPAITEPAFGEDWSEIEYEIERSTGETAVLRPRLSFEDRVLGVVRDGRARAYPLKLLDWHEVVNDDFGGPLAVTYCPVCNSGLVADRRIDGEATTFGVSGYLYRANLVMYDDHTESLWSQLHATAIRGPATGTELSLVPSTITSWGQWQVDHRTEVLLPPPRSETVLGAVRYNYSIDLYERKRRVAERYPDKGPLGALEWRDDRLRRRTVVVGVSEGGEAVAYPAHAVLAEGPIEDSVGGRPIVVLRGPDDTLSAYDRRVDGETLSFSDADGWHVAAGGSRWRPISGRAVDGPYQGRRLGPVRGASQLFWAAWLQFHPETAVYGIDG